MRSTALLLLVLLALPASAAQLLESKKPAAVRDLFAPRAKLHVVNLWATWCQPCVAEMADLKTIDTHFGDEVQLIGVSFDDTIPGSRPAAIRKVREFLAKQAIGWANLYYTGPIGEAQTFFNFEGEIPITIVYDSAGREVLRHQGTIDRASLTTALEKLLQERRFRRK
jgi:thiol-disulfide isomerase/thioredoxin